MSPVIIILGFDEIRYALQGIRTEHCVVKLSERPTALVGIDDTTFSVSMQF